MPPINAPYIMPKIYPPRKINSVMSSTFGTGANKNPITTHSAIYRLIYDMVAAACFITG